MAPLVVDPEALSAAGSAVTVAGDGLATALTMLTAGFGANTGHDAAGTVFGLAYQSAADSLVTSATAAINATRYNGARIQLSASNYAQAEAASTLGGQSSALQPPGEPVHIAPPGPPGTLGPGAFPPPLWGLVQSFIDDVWPDGDVAALHKAAGCWRSFAAAVRGVQGALITSTTQIGTQQIAEGARMKTDLSKMSTGVAGLGEQCEKMAGTLDGFANGVEQAQHAIRDLLQRLGALCDVWHDVVAIFHGDAIDEIKAIAEDVKAVLLNLGREARAKEQQMQLGMKVLDGMIIGMEKDMRGVFTHFLGDDVGNPAATVFDTVVNVNEGVLKEFVGSVQSLEDLGPWWFLLNPKGAAATWASMTRAGLINDVLNPQQAGQAHAQAFKSMLHLEDWRADRPGLGAGENLLDFATLFVPGLGEAGAGVKGAAAAARGTEVASEVADGAGAVGRAGREIGGLARAGNALGDIGRTGGGLSKDFEGLTGNLAKTDTAVGGRPVGLPPESARPSEHLPPSKTPTAEPVPHSAHPGTPAPPHGPDGAHVPEPAPEPGPTIISGHGAYNPVYGHTVVPPGTTITLYAEHGSSITDALGNLIETGGDTSGVYSKTFHPGDQIPDYTISPPDGLNIMGSPQTVSEPTLLSQLINEDMGDVRLAICPYDPTHPTGKIYDVHGMYDGSTGIYYEYLPKGFDLKVYGHDAK